VQSIADVLGRPPDDSGISSVLNRLLDSYPADVRPALREDAPRFVEHASWVRGASSLLDIGGGFSPFGPLCATLGASVVVVDSFEHEFFMRADLRETVTATGTQLLARDAVREPLGLERGSFDAITSFDSLEHWHHSPKQLFAELRSVAHTGTVFVLGAPNAVNLRKRIAVPLGRSNWALFDDWYHEPTFFGHVREPTVSDLRLISEDLGLKNWTIVGRNWLGYRGTELRAWITRAIDRPLRLRPALCANLYLVGRF
jgi:SAM-dependent methyltransferase